LFARDQAVEAWLRDVVAAVDALSQRGQSRARDNDGEIMNSNRNKLALRRQSIRTLTDSELRIVNGGGTGGAPAPGTDRQTIGTSGTSVISPSGSRALNPSGG